MTLENNVKESDKMRDFPPNINPELFSILGAVAGLIIEGDYTANELNSIG